MDNSEMMSFEFKEGILIATYLSNKAITEQIAIELVKKRKEFTGGKDVKMIMVFHALTNMDKGARDYLSTAEAKEGVLASAMVADSVIVKVIINFFLKLNNNNNNEIPNKVFNNVDDAMEWIKKIHVN